MDVALRGMLSSDSWISALGLSSALEKQKGQEENVIQGRPKHDTVIGHKSHSTAG